VLVAVCEGGVLASRQAAAVMSAGLERYVSSLHLQQLTHSLTHTAMSVHRYCFTLPNEPATTSSTATLSSTNTDVYNTVCDLKLEPLNSNSAVQHRNITSLNTKI